MASPMDKYTLSIDVSSDCYPFIVTTEEHKRLDEQSAAFNELMFGKALQAPVSSPTKILDIGCGTGIQTVLLAKQFPSALVIGIDPSPVPDTHEKPENVVYLLGNFEDLLGKHELLQEGSFDLIYQRVLMLTITDWPARLISVHKLLKPGGFIECQEFNPYYAFDAKGDRVGEEWEFSQVIEGALRKTGFDMRVGPKLQDLLQEAGFATIGKRTFPVPVRGDWTERPEAQRLGRYWNWGSRQFVKLMAEKAGGERSERLIQEAEGKYFGGPVGLHDLFWVVWGKKA